MGNPQSKILLGLWVLFGLTACGLVNNAPQLRSGLNSSTSQCVAGLGYPDAQKILARSCVGCHGGNARTNLTTYTDVFNLRDRIKVQVETGAMPMGGSLDATSKSMLLNWISAGAPEAGEAQACDKTAPVEENPNRPAEPDPGPQPLVASYEGLKSSFLAAKCIGCHQSGGPAETYDFSTYNAMMGVFEFIDEDLFDVEEPEKSGIVRSVRGEGRRLMPPSRSNIPALGEPEIQQLIAWISKSMPEK